MIDECRVQCPWCWESIELLVDASAGSQSYVEDCSVCCRPMVVRVEIGADGAPSVSVEQE